MAPKDRPFDKSCGRVFEARQRVSCRPEQARQTYRAQCTREGRGRDGSGAEQKRQSSRCVHFFFQLKALKKVVSSPRKQVLTLRHSSLACLSLARTPRTNADGAEVPRDCAAARTHTHPPLLSPPLSTDPHRCNNLHPRYCAQRAPDAHAPARPGTAGTRCTARPRPHHSPSASRNIAPTQLHAAAT